MLWIYKQAVRLYSTGVILATVRSTAVNKSFIRTFLNNISFKHFRKDDGHDDDDDDSDDDDDDEDDDGNSEVDDDDDDDEDDDGNSEVDDDDDDDDDDDTGMNSR